jgi:hypothetical protein
MEEGAPLVYFQRANDREVDVYQADEEFYLTHIDSLARGRIPPSARKLYRRPYEHVPVTEAGLQAKVSEHLEVRGEESAMKRLFKDAALQSEFERDGYVVIELLDREQSTARAFYAGLANAVPPPGGFQVSLDNDSPEFVRAVVEAHETVGSGWPRGPPDLHGELRRRRDPLGAVPRRTRA